MKRLTRTSFLILALAMLLSSLVAHAQPPSSAADGAQRSYTYLPLIRSGAASLPTSDHLIDQAIGSGALDAQTGLLYKVYAAFEDARLPAQYRGSGPGASNMALTEASEQLSTLRPEVRAAIAPFLLPPNAPGSWLEQRESAGAAQVQVAAAAKHPWVSLGDELLPRRPYRIWYRPSLSEVEAVRGARVLAAMDNSIWPELTALMGRPRPDTEFTNNGAGPEFDIYLVNNSTKTVPYAGRGCSQNAAYVLLDTNRVDGQGLAAEVMLAILYGYKVGGCDEYEWLFKTSATWAVDHVYPDEQDERVYARELLENPEVPLEQDHNVDELEPLSLIGPSDSGQYLLPFYLARKLGQPQRVRAIWDAAGVGNSLAAVNAGLPGGFEQLWPQFALANWNRPPYDDYTKLDGVDAQAAYAMEREISMGGQGLVSLDITPADVPHLSARYYRFTFTGDDARGVTFYNGWTYDLQKSPQGVYSFKPAPGEITQGAKIQALLKIRGEWQPIQDWTNQPFSFFCRDRQAERVDELVLVVSNSTWQDRKHVLEPAGQPPKLAVSNIGCHQWEGAITKKTNSSQRDWPGFSRQTVVTQVTWNEMPPPPGGADPMVSLLTNYAFEPQGSVTFEEIYERYVEGRDGPVLDCGGTARGQQTLIPVAGRLTMHPVLAPDSPLARGYDAEGSINMEIIMPPCEGGNETGEIIFFKLPDIVKLTVEPNGTLIKGQWSSDCSDEIEQCTESYSWEFRARREQ